MSLIIDRLCEPNTVPTCVLNFKVIKILGFAFTLNFQRDKKNYVLKFGVELI